MQVPGPELVVYPTGRDTHSSEVHLVPGDQQVVSPLRPGTVRGHRIQNRLQRNEYWVQPLPRLHRKGHFVFQPRDTRIPGDSRIDAKAHVPQSAMVGADIPHAHIGLQPGHQHGLVKTEAARNSRPIGTVFKVLDQVIELAKGQHPYCQPRRRQLQPAVGHQVVLKRRPVDRTRLFGPILQFFSLPCGGSRRPAHCAGATP